MGTVGGLISWVLGKNRMYPVGKSLKKAQNNLTVKELSLNICQAQNAKLV